MLSIPLPLFRHPEASACANPGFCNHATTLVVLSDRFSVATADFTRELSICVARLGAVATIFAPFCRGEMLCVNSTNACSHPMTAVAGSGNSNERLFRLCATEVDFGLKVGDKESVLSASMIPSQIALGWGLVGRIEQRVRLISWRSICFHSTSFISEVAEARVDNRPKYPALGFDSNFGSFRINEQCRESSA